MSTTPSAQGNPFGISIREIVYLVTSSSGSSPSVMVNGKARLVTNIVSSTITTLTGKSSPRGDPSCRMTRKSPQLSDHAAVLVENHHLVCLIRRNYEPAAVKRNP